MLSKSLSSLRDVQNRLLQHLSYGIPDKLLDRIQRIQNCAVRVVLRLHNFSHIAQALTTLNWLHVNRRALMVYKVLNGPANLNRRSPTALRSTPEAVRGWQATPFTVTCHLKSYSDHAFPCAAPVVWNNIPHSVKTVDSFKVKLKTHFYSVSFAKWYVTFSIVIYTDWPCALSSPRLHKFAHNKSPLLSLLSLLLSSSSSSLLLFLLLLLLLSLSLSLSSSLSLIILLL